MNILITGGAGFIGSNLCEYFLRSGNTVICLDNFSTGYRKNIQEFLKLAKTFQKITKFSTANEFLNIQDPIARIKKLKI